MLIGRTAELSAFHLLIEQAKGGNGLVALLSGEAGVGKSRLVAEVKTFAEREGFLLLRGNCFQADRAFPYAPFLDLLRLHLSGSSPLTRQQDLLPFAQELSQFLPDVNPLISERSPLILSSPLDPQVEQRRLFALLLHFFTEQATRQPLLFVLEDLHWSDETSLELLLYLARNCTHLPILFVLTYRSDEVSPGLRHTLAEFDRGHLAQEFFLQPLSRAEVDVMLRAIFAKHQATPTGLGESIYALTEGNPFYIEEMLKSLLATGEIAIREGVWERTLLFGTHTRSPSLPRSVQDAVYQRTKLLNTFARQVLTLAAVAGRRFDLALLQQVMQIDESRLLACMKELVAAQLVSEEAPDQFLFRHALTREAVYTELLAGERRVLHRRIAEATEQRALSTSILDAQLVDLAYHFYEAGVWSKAAEYGRRAGERALILYAPRAAVEHLTRTLDALSRLGSPPPTALLRARGQAYETIGEFERARADYERTLEIALQTQDGAMQWQSLLDIGYLTRKYGLSIDNLLAADVVLADSSCVTADESHNADLFWALRGGGGNFGVVTSFLFQAHPVHTLYAGPMLWELDQAPEVMRWYGEFITQAPEDLNGFFAFLIVPPGPPFPEYLHSKSMCGVVWCYTGPIELAEATFKPIREKFPPALDFVGPIPHPALQSMFDPLYAPGFQWYWKADFVSALGDEAIKVYMKHGSQLPTIQSTMHLYPVNGAARRVGKNATAWSYRDATWAEVIVGVDPDPARKDLIVTWARQYWEDVHPYSAGGAYVNFMMDEGEDRVKASYRDNYERLAAIKHTYDPTNFFRVNQNIKPV